MFSRRKPAGDDSTLPQVTSDPLVRAGTVRVKLADLDTALRSSSAGRGLVAAGLVQGLVVAGFVVAVFATLALSRFGEAPEPAKA